jgi:arsenate reductase
MRGVIVHGIPNCDTVKKARNWLDQHGVAYEFHDFRKAGVDSAMLLGWLAEIPLDTLLNRRGTTWRGLPDDVKSSANQVDGALALMIEKPSLIKRPVLIANGRVAAVGFSDEQYRALF